MTQPFKAAVAQVSDSHWKPIYKEVNGKKMKTGSEWAEICFVPNKLCCKKNAPEYRYLAKRQILETQLSLSNMDNPEPSLPFPTIEMEDTKYNVSSI